MTTKGAFFTNVEGDFFPDRTFQWNVWTDFEFDKQVDAFTVKTAFTVYVKSVAAKTLAFADVRDQMRQLATQALGTAGLALERLVASPERAHEHHFGVVQCLLSIQLPEKEDSAHP